VIDIDKGKGEKRDGEKRDRGKSRLDHRESEIMYRG